MFRLLSIDLEFLERAREGLFSKSSSRKVDTKLFINHKNDTAYFLRLLFKEIDVL